MIDGCILGLVSGENDIKYNELMFCAISGSFFIIFMSSLTRWFVLKMKEL